MPILTHTHESGIVEIVVDHPPVNALNVAGWFELADLVTAAGRAPETRVVVLRAEGRGFNAGVDIKEMQRTTGFDALLGANKGCYAAFKAVYECEVPVIAAVHGFCVGGGIGLVGNADMIVASDAATHLARLVPQLKMRAMVYTCENATAQELHAYGSIYKLVPRAELRDTAMTLTASIAAKRGAVIRAAKQSLNGIDPVDVNRSYRYEQGFTYELNLAGVADEARNEFAGTTKNAPATSKND